MPRPSFAPTPRPGESAATTAPTTTKASSQSTLYQPTLFELHFGPSRARKPSSKALSTAKRSLSHPAPPGKRPRIQVNELGGGDDDDDVRLHPIHDANADTYTATAVGPLNGHRGPFHPVTRKSFCDAYRVDGLPDADVYYRTGWIDPRTAERWRKELDALPEWYRPKLKVYGREITQSREICAYATEPGLDLKYSGHPVEMHSPFPPLLNHIASLLCRDDCLGPEVRFNHCMLNRYDDGSVYIGRHSDNCENKVIVTVSLGADRSWIMERKSPRRRAQADPSDEEKRVKQRWILGNGSLLVMQGDTQKHYTHEIPKELKVARPRISITFRQLVYA
ncbi:hypothetical protein ACQY0O_000498 [Thecaphora frezii]